jgi:hypothetical protein
MTPWWVRVGVIFLVSRVITTTILLAFAAKQPLNSWTSAHPGYFDFARIWDGNWYWIVAASGYPSDLPMTTDGHVAENAWAFLPGYPAVVRLVMLTGLDFAVAGVIVSVGFALGTALMFYKLMRTALPEGTALFAVVLYCVAPLSPILQVSYAESMFAFFLTLSLYLLVTRRYVLLIPALAAMDFTRPGGLAFALALGLHVIYRWVKRRSEPFPVRERIEAVGVTAIAVVLGFIWPVIAWAATGEMHAYTETELAWRSVYIGYQELIPFTAWIQGANWWLPQPWGPILLALAVIAFALFMVTPWVKRLGVDIRLWSVSFVLYILAVFFPQSSTFRILMPTFPLLGAVAQPTSRVYRVLVVAVFIVLQVGWVYIAWWVDGYDWTPP